MVVEYRWQTDAPDRDSGVFVNTVENNKRFTSLECDIPRKEAGLPGRLWLFGRGAKGITVDGQRIVTQGVEPSQAKSLDKAGEWNVLEVLCRAGKFQIKLNGQITVLGSEPTPQAGAIMLQSSKGAIQFRRVEITNFDAASGEKGK